LRHIKKGLPKPFRLADLSYSIRRGEVQLQIPNPSNFENILRMDAEIAKEEYDSALTQFLQLCVVHTRTDWDPDEMEERVQSAYGSPVRRGPRPPSG
jgi:hypothetical protein